MKTTQTLLAAAILGTSLFATQANATLISALNGQVVNDTDLNITWLANANLAQSNNFGVGGNSGGYMYWNTAQQWIVAMNTANYLGYNDWRLPTTLQPDASCSSQVDGISSDLNCTGSEMGHLFYSELGGVAGKSIGYTHNANYGLFNNIQDDKYWSGTEYAPNTNGAWVLNWNYGGQYYTGKYDPHFVWAVRDGQVGGSSVPPIKSAVPEPGTLLLLGSGLLGLIVAQRRVAIR